MEKGSGLFFFELGSEDPFRAVSRHEIVCLLIRPYRVATEKEKEQLQILHFAVLRSGWQLSGDAILSGRINKCDQTLTVSSSVCLHAESFVWRASAT